VLRRLVGEHFSGRVDHADQLWALVNLELWLRRFVDADEDAGMRRLASGRGLKTA
jgi:hypothetical protein